MADEKDIEVCDMLSVVVRSLVDRAEDVRVDPISHCTGTTFQIRAHPTDLGKLIGVGGRIARALRIIVHANAVRLGRSFSVDIVSQRQLED